MMLKVVEIIEWEIDRFEVKFKFDGKYVYIKPIWVHNECAIFTSWDDHKSKAVHLVNWNERIRDRMCKNCGDEIYWRDCPYEMFCCTCIRRDYQYDYFERKAKIIQGTYQLCELGRMDGIYYNNKQYTIVRYWSGNIYNDFEVAYNFDNRILDVIKLKSGRSFKREIDANNKKFARTPIKMSLLEKRLHSIRVAQFQFQKGE